MTDPNLNDMLGHYVKMGDDSVDKMVATTDKIVVLEHEGQSYVSADAIGAVCTAFIMAETFGVQSADIKMLYTMIALVERSKGKRLSDSMDKLTGNEKTAEQVADDGDEKIRQLFEQIIKDADKP